MLPYVRLDPNIRIVANWFVRFNWFDSCGLLVDFLTSFWISLVSEDISCLMCNICMVEMWWHTCFRLLVGWNRDCGISYFAQHYVNFRNSFWSKCSISIVSFFRFFKKPQEQEKAEDLLSFTPFLGKSFSGDIFTLFCSSVIWVGMGRLPSLWTASFQSFFYQVLRNVWEFGR